MRCPFSQTVLSVQGLGFRGEGRNVRSKVLKRAFKGSFGLYNFSLEFPVLDEGLYGDRYVATRVCRISCSGVDN